MLRHGKHVSEIHGQSAFGNSNSVTTPRTMLEWLRNSCPNPRGIDTAKMPLSLISQRICFWTGDPGHELLKFGHKMLTSTSGLGVARMQAGILKESALMQQIGGITQGIKQVLEHAAIQDTDATRL